MHLTGLKAEIWHKNRKRFIMVLNREVVTRIFSYPERITKNSEVTFLKKKKKLAVESIETENRRKNHNILLEQHNTTHRISSNQDY